MMPTSRLGFRPLCVLGAFTLSVIGISLLPGCRKPTPPPALTHVVAHWSGDLPDDPGDARWHTVPEHVAPLIEQDMVEPRQLQPTTREVRVRALWDGRDLVVRLDWDDPTMNDLPGDSRFADACAIQFPRRIESTIPAPQMGEPGHAVEIAMWSATWQATVNGRGDTIRDLYPHAAVDHYPFEAAVLEPGSPSQQEMALRYAPARALGNTMAGPREVPVQDLLAEGPGTLEPDPEGRSTGHGLRTDHGWQVVIRRPCPEGLEPQYGSQIALAVWDGDRQEVGARKMRTGWIPLSVEERNP
jgi:DMSO reductase family type II enzyme heme b subunit